MPHHKIFSDLAAPAQYSTCLTTCAFRAQEVFLVDRFGSERQAGVNIYGAGQRGSKLARPPRYQQFNPAFQTI